VLPFALPFAIQLIRQSADYKKKEPRQALYPLLKVKNYNLYKSVPTGC
jgi:hypothetical protein